MAAKIFKLVLLLLILLPLVPPSVASEGGVICTKTVTSTIIETYGVIVAIPS
ncbi:hypothetical protein LTR28_009001, partial [Elasticomyces elasticus]